MNHSQSFIHVDISSSYPIIAVIRLAQSIKLLGKRCFFYMWEVPNRFLKIGLAPNHPLVMGIFMGIFRLKPPIPRPSPGLFEWLPRVAAIRLHPGGRKTDPGTTWEGMIHGDNMGFNKQNSIMGTRRIPSRFTYMILSMLFYGRRIDSYYSSSFVWQAQNDQTAVENHLEHPCNRTHTFLAQQDVVPQIIYYPLVNIHSYWKLPFTVDLPIKNGGSFHSYVKLPEGNTTMKMIDFSPWGLLQSLFSPRSSNLSHKNG